MIRVRAEENALLIWNREEARTAYISGEELKALERWTHGQNSGFSTRLKNLGLITDGDIPEIKQAINKAVKIKAPPHSFCAPESLHVELTAKCPLQCPQCYKERGTAELPLQTLLDAIRQADEMNVFQIALGGGEPLIYPYLTEAVSEISRRGMASSVTTSGYGLNELFLSRLQCAGLNHIQISLNGSNEVIHSQSRDGFKEGIAALKLLQKSEISYGINWVARADNIDDLPALVELAKGYHACNINILRYKPSQCEEFLAVNPSGEQLDRLARTIKKVKGIHLKVDSAFSNLLCHINGRPGTFSGCGAGRRFLALDVEGCYRPCSHVDKLFGENLKEQMDNLSDIWNDSPNLTLFRMLPESIGEPCCFCENLSGCGGCRAIILGQGQDFSAGDSTCRFVKLENT